MYGQMPCENYEQQDSATIQSARPISIFCMCSEKVLAFLAFLFAGALGLILGAFFSATLLASIAAVIVGAVILAILVIALIIYRKCTGCTGCNCCKCCR